MLHRPIQERTFTSTAKPPLFVPFTGQSRPSQYKCWNEDQLHKAYEAVINDGFSVRRAAEEYNIPKSTLHDRISGRVMFGAHSGPAKYLSSTEEEELVAFLLGCASLGYPRSRKEIIALVQGVMNNKGHCVKVSNGWWDSFRRRHPNLTLRNPEALAHVRAVCCSPNVINKYFDLLEETLNTNGLRDRPCQIFNCDESGFPLNPCSPKVVVMKGQKHPYAISSGDKTQITVLTCCSAGGNVIPPLVVFDRKCLKPEMTVGEVPGTMYGLSDSGWMDGELFDQWFRHHFLAHAPPARPLLLLLDGHSSHYTPDLISKAVEEGIIIFCLPPHSTHLTQPLDRSVFATLKHCWKEENHKYMSENPGKVVTRFSFCRVFSKAWISGMTMQNVITGFRITGVFPVDRTVIATSPLPTPKVISEELQTRTGVSFVPLYSPVVHKKQHSVLTFSDDEMLLFQHRYEEGYDLVDDAMYNRWLEMYHPDLSTTVTLPCSTIMSKFIGKEPQVKLPEKETRTKARVLTSEENRLMIEEKDRKKKKSLKRRWKI